MVSRASSGLGDDTVEPQCRQIQFVDERFNNPDRVVLRHVVIQAVREQRSLPRSSPSTKRFIPPAPNSRTLNYHVKAISHALGQQFALGDAVRDGSIAPAAVIPAHAENCDSCFRAVQLVGARIGHVGE